MNSNLIGTLWRRRPSLFLECLAPAEACRSRGAAGHFFLKRPESPLARERRRALAGQIPLPFREEASIDPQVPSRLRDADTLLGDEPDRFDLELRRMLPSCNSHGPSSSDRTLRESFPGVHGGGARSVRPGKPEDATARLAATASRPDGGRVSATLRTTASLPRTLVGFPSRIRSRAQTGREQRKTRRTPRES